MRPVAPLTGSDGVVCMLNVSKIQYGVGALVAVRG